MSWRERDYTWFPGSDRPYRDRVATWREFAPPRATTGLLLLHLAGFILTAVLGRSPSAPDFALRGVDGITWLGVLTHPIAGASVFTLLFVMMAIWILGGRIEASLGARTLLVPYALGGLAGGLAYVAVASIRPELGAAPLITPLGAMMAWTTIIWRRLPFESIPVFLKEFPLAKVAAFVAALGAAGMVLTAGLGAAAWMAAGLTGMAIPIVTDGMSAWRVRRATPRTRGFASPSSAAARSDRENAEQTAPGEVIEIDDILAKISRGGMASLTNEDKSRLEEARRARLRD